MKGRHRRARFVRIAHFTRLLNFTDANYTHNTHTSTRIFVVLKVQRSPKVVPACAVGAGMSARRQPSRTRLKEAKPVLAHDESRRVRQPQELPAGTPTRRCVLSENQPLG